MLVTQGIDLAISVPSLLILSLDQEVVGLSQNQPCFGAGWVNGCGKAQISDSTGMQRESSQSDLAERDDVPTRNRGARFPGGAAEGAGAERFRRCLAQTLFSSAQHRRLWLHHCPPEGTLLRRML